MSPEAPKTDPFDLLLAGFKLVGIGMLAYCVYIGVLIATHSYDKLFNTVVNLVLTYLAFSVISPLLYFAVLILSFPFVLIFARPNEWEIFAIFAFLWVLAQVIWHIWWI